MGPSWLDFRSKIGLWRPPGGPLGPLGGPGPLLGRSGSVQGPCLGPSWAALGSSGAQHGAKMGPTLAQHGLKIEVRGLSQALLDRSWCRGRFGDRFRPSSRLENRAEMHGKKCALHALSASVFAPFKGAQQRSGARGLCVLARFLAASLR